MSAREAMKCVCAETSMRNCPEHQHPTSSFCPWCLDDVDTSIYIEHEGQRWHRDCWDVAVPDDE